MKPIMTVRVVLIFMDFSWLVDERAGGEALSSQCPVRRSDRDRCKQAQCARYPCGPARGRTCPDVPDLFDRTVDAGEREVPRVAFARLWTRAWRLSRATPGNPRMRRFPRRTSGRRACMSASCPQEAQLRSDADGLGAIAARQLLEDALQVISDGPAGNVEPGCNVAGAQPFGAQRKHLKLPL